MTLDAEVVALLTGEILHFGDVSACNKGLAASGHDKAAQFAVLFELLDQLVKLIEHIRIDCVERSGAVDRYDADIALLFIKNTVLHCIALCPFETIFY